MAEKLKRCPFCGSIAVIQRGRQGYYGRCSRCPCAFVMEFDSYDEAVGAWNYRRRGKPKYLVVEAL